MGDATRRPHGDRSRLASAHARGDWLTRGFRLARSAGWTGVARKANKACRSGKNLVTDCTYDAEDVPRRERFKEWIEQVD